MDGLVQIVRAAGGPQSPELSEKTRRHLFLYVESPRQHWPYVDQLSVDLAASISLNSKPLLPSTLDLRDLEPYFGPANPLTWAHAKTFGTRLYNYTGSPLSDLAVNVWWGLRNISELLDAINDGRETPDTVSASDIQFSDRVEVLERLVHQLWFVENRAAPQHPLFKTFGFTCLIYIYSIFRELPKELGMNVMLAKRVKIAMESCGEGELRVLLATFSDLLLWEMFICGRIADLRDRLFFAQQATKVLMVRKVEERSDILVAAEKFLWPERGTEPALGAAGAYPSTETIGTSDS